MPHHREHHLEERTAVFERHVVTRVQVVLETEVDLAHQLVGLQFALQVRRAAQRRSGKLTELGLQELEQLLLRRASLAPCRQESRDVTAPGRHPRPRSLLPADARCVA